MRVFAGCHLLASSVFMSGLFALCLRRYALFPIPHVARTLSLSRNHRDVDRGSGKSQVATADRSYNLSNLRSIHRKIPMRVTLLSK